MSFTLGVVADRLAVRISHSPHSRAIELFGVGVTITVGIAFAGVAGGSIMSVVAERSTDYQVA